MLEALPLILFVLVFVLVLAGFPVAFTLGGLSVLVGIFIFDLDFFYLLSLRVFGIMTNYVLLAVPLFVYMGMIGNFSSFCRCSIGSFHRSSRCDCGYDGFD